RLARLLGGVAEDRPQQSDYAAGAAAAFAPRERAGEPRVVLAEAGTGVGKTLGYIAPASVWAEKNAGTVWISTFTRNLQRQLDAEMDRLYPDQLEKNRKVVVRKGRENYLCLLNFEEAVGRLGPGDAVALGLMARWAGATRDGDMVGGDFPAWLADMLGARLTVDLTDTRGECIYSACRHYTKCFIERTIRRARRAEMVIANHALVMIQAAIGDEGSLPIRYVFDEGHHLFEAADGAFSAHLTGAETADLRRWIIGEGRRSRGLALRMRGLLDGNDAAGQALDEALKAAHALPGPGWRQRLAGEAPQGTAEAFFAHVRRQVYARAPESPYSLETETEPPIEGLADATARLDTALARLERPLGALIGELGCLLDDGADELDTPTRNSIEALRRGLERRGILPLKDWRAMLRDLHEETPPEFVDWFGVERIGGRDVDLGLHRHWVDPVRPFAGAVAETAHGILITSATLTDQTGDEAADWAAADLRTGARHMEGPVEHLAQSSPFDHAGRTRVLVIGDVDRNNPDQVAAAYRELFKASGGGALGLFTAAARLKAVHERIARPLDEAGLQLLAQHVDTMDTGTLIDIFRAEEDACLLGTDAVRDGVDVPGRSLRLIVFDRVPWPRPDILHKTRRQVFGGRAYDEMLTRLRLKQAYGRLLRRSDDRGVFVMLDRALPSRLAAAFPAGVEVRRLGLKDAITVTRDFLALDGPGGGGL
ncbi:MAG: ATP-dependent DNA helicase, partial [Proteobacteria bacterium]|nr:ATP-dependent DNA helicase [Pseudomonadota bacterium]